MTAPDEVVQAEPVIPRRLMRTEPQDLGMRDVRPPRALRQRRLPEWRTAASFAGGSRALEPTPR
jgi:hypothetical protein